MIVGVCIGCGTCVDVVGGIIVSGPSAGTGGNRAVSIGIVAGEIVHELILVTCCIVAVGTVEDTDGEDLYAAVLKGERFVYCIVCSFGTVLAGTAVGGSAVSKDDDDLVSVGICSAVSCLSFAQQSVSYLQTVVHSGIAVFRKAVDGVLQTVHTALVNNGEVCDCLGVVAVYTAVAPTVSGTSVVTDLSEVIGIIESCGGELYKGNAVFVISIGYGVVLELCGLDEVVDGALHGRHAVAVVHTGGKVYQYDYVGRYGADTGLYRACGIGFDGYIHHAGGRVICRGFLHIYAV